MSHEMGIEEESRLGIHSEMHKGVKRATPFCKIFLNALEFRCILLQPLRRDILIRKKRYTTGETGTLPTEKTQRRKENTLSEKLERELFP